MKDSFSRIKDMGREYTTTLTLDTTMDGSKTMSKKVTQFKFYKKKPYIVEIFSTDFAMEAMDFILIPIKINILGNGN
jgi:hypothetical protein